MTHAHGPADLARIETGRVERVVLARAMRARTSSGE